jgi:hypothetical protein
MHDFLFGNRYNGTEKLPHITWMAARSCVTSECEGKFTPVLRQHRLRAL